MDKTGNLSLIGTTVNEYGGEKALDQTLNHLYYPTSIYDNCRNGSHDRCRVLLCLSHLVLLFLGP